MASNRARLIKFKFKPPMACGEVKLAGDFTNWGNGAIVMTKSGKSGEWVASTRVTPGEHQYRFLIDGNWYTDPTTEHTVNPFGGENSVLRVS